MSKPAIAYDPSGLPGVILGITGAVICWLAVDGAAAVAFFIGSLVGSIRYRR